MADILPSLDIIIVNWNSGSQLGQCLDSIASTRPQDVDLRRVVVVDNGSTDDSARSLAPRGLPLVQIDNEENRGFAAACNQGARGSQAQYLLFLNPDTIVLPDSFSIPLAFMEAPASSSVGICGIQLVDGNGAVSRSCSRFPRPSMFLSKMVGISSLLPPALGSQPMSEWDHAADRDVDQVIGAFFLVRRELFETLQGFDERFFVYFEEVDFSLRAAARGFRTRFLASARAMHTGGGCSDQVRAKRLAYSIRSRCEYARKNFTWPSAALLVGATLTIEPIVRMGDALVRGPAGSFRETLRGFQLVWASTPTWLVGPSASTNERDRS